MRVPAVAAGLGLGTRFGEKPLTFDLDGIGMYTGTAQFASEIEAAVAIWAQLRGTFQWSFFERLAVTGGVSLNLLVKDPPQEPRLRPPEQIPSLKLDAMSWMWVGAHAGVRF